MVFYAYMKYTGSCQCGAVKYEVEADLASVMSCNCSRCGRLGWLMTFVPASAFTLFSGEDDLTEYRFNKKLIAHLFCKICGIESFARGVGPDGSETVAVNVRCLEGVDPSMLTITPYNGKDY